MSAAGTQQPPADALVLFGSTGDLAKRKLFPALYQLERRGELKVPVIGVARSNWTDDDFRHQAQESAREHIGDVDEKILDDLVARMDLVQGDYAAASTWETLRETLDRCGSEVAVYYMAIPPEMFPVVATSLATVGLNTRGRIVVEKPFGRDLESARQLNVTLHEIFPEERIFRIDHYLGKEAVEDLLVFRFSNMLLEPVWNRNYVRSVQVTMAESIGVEGRGSFYEGVGAIRDVLQNHLLQVVSLLAIEPPVDPDASYLQDEKAKILAAMEPIDPKCMVRGQYIGYREEPGVDAHSMVETYVATRLCIDSWRWAGVPWYVRVGKALTHSVTEAVVELPRAAAVVVRRGRRSTTPAQPGPLPAGQGRRRHVRPAGEDPRAAPRQSGGRRQRRLRRGPRRAPRGVRASARRRPRRFAPSVRPRGRRGADLGRRPAGARRAGRDPSLLPRDLGPVRGRPCPRRRRLVRTVVEIWARRCHRAIWTALGPDPGLSAPRSMDETLHAQICEHRVKARRPMNSSRAPVLRRLLRHRLRFEADVGEQPQPRSRPNRPRWWARRSSPRGRRRRGARRRSASCVEVSVGSGSQLHSR